jgi:hypothetical protein
LQAQLNVRAYLKNRFPKRPWLDVVSKGDIPIPDSVLQYLPPNHLRVSVTTGQNLDVLKATIQKTLANLKDTLLKTKVSLEE